jgi:hypothetical protein
VLVVETTTSLVIGSYSTFQGGRDTCVIIARYQSLNFLDSPENFGQSDF